MATNSWVTTYTQNEAAFQVVTHHNSIGERLRRLTTTQVTFGLNVF